MTSLAGVKRGRESESRKRTIIAPGLIRKLKEGQRLDLSYEWNEPFSPCANIDQGELIKQVDLFGRE